MIDTDQHFKDHVAKLAKNPTHIWQSMTPPQLDMIHAIVGLTGEVGELTDALKKHFIYNKGLDLENVMEELGDIEFYLEMLRARFGFSREAVLEHNIDKLKERYPDGYTDEAAQERADKAKSPPLPRYGI